MDVRAVIQVTYTFIHLLSYMHSLSHLFMRTLITPEQAYEYVNFNGGMTLASDYEYTSGEKGVTGK